MRKILTLSKGHKRFNHAHPETQKWIAFLNNPATSRNLTELLSDTQYIFLCDDTEEGVPRKTSLALTRTGLIKVTIPTTFSGHSRSVELSLDDFLQRYYKITNESSLPLLERLTTLLCPPIDHATRDETPPNARANSAQPHKRE